LTKVGCDAAGVLAAELEFRWPEISAAEIRASLFEA
jgi:hypothetical protein